MRHKCKNKKLGRSKAHREAMLAAMVCSLIEHEQIKTTVPKAKQARVLAEKMITLGKSGTLAARRRAIAKLRQEKAVKKLFEELSGRYADRNGGYTRVIKLGRRSSDGSEMGILEWVTDSAAPAKRRTRPEPVAEKEPTEEAKEKPAAAAEADGVAPEAATDEPEAEEPAEGEDEKSGK